MKKAYAMSNYHQCVLPPGYIATTKEPSLLCSVCGPGVIVAIWDRIRRIGGMVHCLFPAPRKKEKPTHYHVSIAIPAVVQRLQKERSTSFRSLEAHVFGGGALPGMKQSDVVLKHVKKELTRMKIPIVSQDTGGTIGRKIMFNTNSGDVLVLKTKNIRRSDWDVHNLIET